MAFKNLMFFLFCAVSPVYAELDAVVATSSATGGKTETTWQDWARRYPDSVDYDGIPVKMLFEAEVPGDYEGKEAALENIKKAYPESKIVPCVDFVLTYARPTADFKEKRSEWLSLIKKYKDNIFPAICSEVISKDKSFNVSGLKIAALSQMELAGTYYQYRGINKGLKDKAVLREGVAEWNKVLEYFPDRFNSKNENLRNGKWGRVIYPAYFTLAQIYGLLGNTDKATVIADEVLKKGPDTEYGGFYTRRAFAEAYLLKAVRAAENKDYAMVETLLKTIVDKYSDVSWHYDHGIGEKYYITATKSAKTLLPKSEALKFIESVTIRLQGKEITAYNRAYLALLKAGLLYDLNKETEANYVLDEALKQHPKEFVDVVNGDLNSTLLGEYFSSNINTPLEKYYEAACKLLGVEKRRDR